MNGAQSSQGEGAQQQRADLPATKRTYRKITQAQIGRICEYIEEKGLSIPATARLVGVSRDNVSYYVQQLALIGPKSAPLRKTQKDCIRNGKLIRRFSEQEDKYINEQCLLGISLTVIARDLGRTRTSVQNRVFALARHQAAQEESQ